MFRCRHAHSDPHMLREAYSLYKLHRKMKAGAHESLVRHLRRMRECGSWALSDNSTGDNSKGAPRPAFFDQFTSVYRNCFGEGALPLDVLAEQLLIGWPSTPSMLDKVISGVRWLLCFAALVLACVAALAPDFLRDRELNFRLPENGWCQVVSIVFMFYACRFNILLFYSGPSSMMSLLAEMADAYRIFESMLMGPNAAAGQGCPYVRVGSVKDIGAWYELYSFFIASSQRRKFSAEVGLGINVLLVLTMSGMLAWYAMDPNWKPGVLFCEALVVLVSFLLFSLPPLFVGLRANMLRRHMWICCGGMRQSRVRTCFAFRTTRSMPRA
ncbi:unnamed protein product [Symbiodinium natans]|uniref:Uncharacterized protein n=1 Tax=Symbiodinium natans TaxID=878477 RepID=A0A812M2Z5_9DINO|nr:unnamed protein product [Symbiodinium natans]